MESLDEPLSVRFKRAAFSWKDNPIEKMQQMADMMDRQLLTNRMLEMNHPGVSLSPQGGTVLIHAELSV